MERITSNDERSDNERVERVEHVEHGDTHRESAAGTSALFSEPLFTLPAGGIDLAAVERSLVEQALDMAHGNQSKAARLLGISRFALRSRIDRHHLREKIKGATTNTLS
jgi:DNA-binding NtrC family response regulator